MCLFSLEGDPPDIFVWLASASFCFILDEICQEISEIVMNKNINAEQTKKAKLESKNQVLVGTKYLKNNTSN
jgi:hypothetical protein